MLQLHSYIFPWSEHWTSISLHTLLYMYYTCKYYKCMHNPLWPPFICRTRLWRMSVGNCAHWRSFEKSVTSVRWQDSLRSPTKFLHTIDGSRKHSRGYWGKWSQSLYHLHRGWQNYVCVLHRPETCSVVVFSALCPSKTLLFVPFTPSLYCSILCTPPMQCTLCPLPPPHCSAPAIVSFVFSPCSILYHIHPSSQL